MNPASGHSVRSSADRGPGILQATIYHGLFDESSAIETGSDAHGGGRSRFHRMFARIQFNVASTIESLRRLVLGRQLGLVQPMNVERALVAGEHAERGIVVTRPHGGHIRERCRGASLAVTLAARIHRIECMTASGHVAGYAFYALMHAGQSAIVAGSDNVVARGGRLRFIEVAFGPIGGMTGVAQAIDHRLFDRNGFAAVHHGGYRLWRDMSLRESVIDIQVRHGRRHDIPVECRFVAEIHAGQETGLKRHVSLMAGEAGDRRRVCRVEIRADQGPGTLRVHGLDDLRDVRRPQLRAVALYAGLIELFAGIVRGIRKLSGQGHGMTAAGPIGPLARMAALTIGCRPIADGHSACLSRHGQGGKGQ